MGKKILEAAIATRTAELAEAGVDTGNDAVKKLVHREVRMKQRIERIDFKLSRETTGKDEAAVLREEREERALEMELATRKLARHANAAA